MFASSDITLNAKQQALHNKRQLWLSPNSQLVYTDDVTNSSIYQHTTETSDLFYVFYKNSYTKPMLAKAHDGTFAHIKNDIQTLANIKLKGQQLNKERKQNEKMALANHPIQVGDVFTWTFSWEYTRAHYYQVVEVNGLNIKLQKIGSNIVEHEHANHMSWYTIPAIDAFLNDEIIETKLKARSKRDGADYYVKINRLDCYFNQKINGEYQPDYNSQD